MAFYKFGIIIKQRREELGYTQEDLAEGICSVVSLSRIENGERMPTKNHIEMLLQRLGLSDAILDSYVNENTLYLHELKFRIRQAVILGQFEKAQGLISDYKCKADMQLPLERQFIILNHTLSTESKYGIEEKLSIFEEAMRLTFPKYSEGSLPRVLSYEEITILNNIAGCYQNLKDYDKAIRILMHIKNYYYRAEVNREEALRTQPMILYNLSKCLGLAGEYSACIAVCDEGIRIAQETGRCKCLASTLYNRAWSLEKRKLPGDLEQAEATAKQAYYAAAVMGNKDAAARYKAFIERNFPNSELLVLG